MRDGSTAACLRRAVPPRVRLITDDRLLDAAVGMAPFLADGNVALFSSHYFTKMPRTGMPVLWHQVHMQMQMQALASALLCWLARDTANSSARMGALGRCAPCMW